MVCSTGLISGDRFRYNTPETYRIINEKLLKNIPGIPCIFEKRGKQIP